MASKLTKQQLLEALAEMLEVDDTTLGSKRTSWGIKNKNTFQGSTEVKNQNDAMEAVKNSLEKQKKEALESYESELAEKGAAFKKFNEELEASNKSAAEKQIERDKKVLELRAAKLSAELKKEKALNEISYKEQKLAAVEEIRRREEIAKIGAAQHLQNLRNKEEDLTKEIEIYKKLKEKGLLTEEQQKAWVSAAKERLATLEREEKLEAGISKAKEKNVSIQQKLASLQENANNRLRIHEKNEKDKNEALEELDALRDAEEITQKDYENRKSEISAEYTRAESDADREYGIYNDGDTKGSLLTAIGAAANNSGFNGIEKVSKVVDSITNISKVIKAAAEGNPLGLIVTALTSLLKAVSSISQGIDKGIGKYENLQVSYLAKVNTRLDNGDLKNTKNFDQITTGFAKIFGASKYFSQQSLVETVSRLAEQGIAYNLEQRTILAELSERMVSTFSMLDTHLINLTKLQQADMSAAQLGAESLLTEFLNDYFEDTSYLTTQYDTVSSILTESFAQMTAQEAVSFNYNVQKWLGSLYALGMTESGINKLAEGINALASGNYEYFTGNDSARTLFASASGTSFADALVNGLDAAGVNTLMENILVYLGDIAADTNKVTKQAKASVFGGLSVTDLRSISNLMMNKSDIDAISNSVTTWSDSIEHVNDYLIDFAEQNTSAALKVQNITENTIYTLGKNFMENENDYAAYKIGGLVGGTVGELVQDIAKGANFFGTVKTIVNNVRSAAFDDISDSLERASSFSMTNTSSNGFWSKLIKQLFGGLISVNNLKDQSYWSLEDAALINERGQAYAANKSGVAAGISQSIFTGFNNSSISTSTIANNADTALTNTLYSQATTAQAGLQNVSSGAVAVRDISDLYAELFETQEHPIRVSVAAIEADANSTLKGNTYNVSDDITHTKLDSSLARVVYL